MRRMATVVLPQLLTTHARACFSTSRTSASSVDAHKELARFLLAKELLDVEPATVDPAAAALAESTMITKQPLLASTGVPVEISNASVSSTPSVSVTATASSTTFARYALRPVVDQFWMPEPMLYGHVPRAPGFYAAIERLERRMDVWI